MRRTFKELPAFTRLVRTGKIPDRVLKDIQHDIMTRGGDVIGGTGGLKKIRTALTARGKSGGARTIYADYPARNLVVLVTAYFKSMKVDLTTDERNALSLMKARLDRQIGA